MVQIPLWKRILIIGVIVLSFLYSAPNVIGKSQQEWLKNHLPSWMPVKTVNLGLDLQGGSHILLQVDLSSIIKQRSEDMIASVRPLLRDQNIGYKRLAIMDNGVRITPREPADAEKISAAIRTLDTSLQSTIKEEGIVESVYTETAIREIKAQALAQSIEIVRRRIDETGTNEPVIQRQGDDRIVVQLPGLDDPERVKQLLGKTAKLSFHLVNMEAAAGGGRAVAGNLVLPVTGGAPGETLAIERRAMLTGDMLNTAAYAQDQNGQPAVSFRFNSIGTKKFCDLSKENVNKLFAIVLDNEIISAPVIREPICGGSGQISGSFSLKEANDLAILLRAGALPAPLTIVEERSIGPSLGADSIQAGKLASALGLALVFILMAGTYGLFGFFACVGMIVNLTICFALLSGLQATLTMPGIAGLVLTVCMSVDANVLIFERIREELRAGHPPIVAIDKGFKIAMGTIIDSNVTTLLGTLILFAFGTGPIKGFAVTTSIGIVASFFTAISVVRLMVVLWLGRRRPEALPI